MNVGERTFAIRANGIVHDTIDGETLVIDLETGSYYTLAQAGAVVWSALVDGASFPTLVERAATSLDIDDATAAGPVARLLAELMRLDLVCSSDGGAPKTPPLESGPPGPSLGLELSAYDELQELMAIDPIHEVDEAGWPHRARESA